MSAPRLTIGIPTHNRPDMLRRAVASALRQSVPVQVLISDDGGDENYARTKEIIEELREDADKGGHRLTAFQPGVTSLWPNWDAVARACDTEFFLWLQDDDVIMPGLAARIEAAFDRFPRADTYMAPLKLGLDDRHHWWNNGNGPWVPLKSDGIPDEWEGEILAPTCYFLAWSLSPGVAFRNGARFRAALDWMPMDCDVFAERLILVGMGHGSRFIADPAVAGLWIQHADNQNRKSHADQPRQSKILIAKLDEAMDRIVDQWAEIMDLWCRLQHPQWIAGWISDFNHVEKEGGRSRYGEAIRAVMTRSLHGRVQFVPIYRPWRRAVNWMLGLVRNRAAL